MSGIESLVVRMYRNLLGDCFLIRVGEQGGPERRILIDCGILQGLGKSEDGTRPSGPDRIRAVADDIRKTCDSGSDGAGAFVDLLVVTHQHFDHVGGFIQARDILLDGGLRFGELWMAWTEDPIDADGKAINARLDARKSALVKLVDALGAAASLESGDTAASMSDDGRTYAPLRERLGPFADFIGPLESDGLGLAEPRLRMATVFAEIKNKAGKVRYLSPGDVVQTPGTAPLTAVVLGPPRDWALLRKDLPSAGADKETYLAEQSLAHWFLPAAEAGPPPSEAGAEDLARSSPFARRYWEDTTMAAVLAAGGEPPTAEAARPARWLYDHYYRVEPGQAGKTGNGPAATGPAKAGGKDEPTPPDQRFRRIDGAWMDAATSLALDLDSDTNNTSLVLAFRLPDGDFMLFAADAQVGNWLSWHNQTYAVGDTPLNATAILNRTRLYKVGHHGSHNATLRSKGLELMSHPDLAAMCSTVEEEAADKRGWQMPNPDVKQQLLAHCKGRLLRGDRRWEADPDTASRRAENASFGARLAYGPPGDGEPLFVELRMI